MIEIFPPGEADPKVQEKSGKTNYNLKIILSFEEKKENVESEESPEFIDLGILYDEGSKGILKGEKVQIKKSYKD